LKSESVSLTETRTTVAEPLPPGVRLGDLEVRTNRVRAVVTAAHGQEQNIDAKRVGKREGDGDGAT
jgi:hypothetical protein